LYSFTVIKSAIVKKWWVIGNPPKT